MGKSSRDNFYHTQEYFVTHNLTHTHTYRENGAQPTDLSARLTSTKGKRVPPIPCNNIESMQACGGIRSSIVLA